MGCAMKVYLIKEDLTVWIGDLIDNPDAKTAEELVTNLVKADGVEIPNIESLPGGYIYPFE